MLDDLLTAHDITQAQLARAVGVERGVVHSWLTRGRIPAERLAAICAALAVTREEAVELYRANGVELPEVLRHVEPVADATAPTNF